MGKDSPTGIQAADANQGIADSCPSDSSSSSRVHVCAGSGDSSGCTGGICDEIEVGQVSDREDRGSNGTDFTTNSVHDLDDTRSTTTGATCTHLCPHEEPQSIREEEGQVGSRAGSFSGTDTSSSSGCPTTNPSALRVRWS